MAFAQRTTDGFVEIEAFISVNLNLEQHLITDQLAK